MAKTISESILSIETTETSLESSLSKCKTSISNKGVSVPSTTRFSNLPALIDKIVEPKCDIYVNGYSRLNVRLYSSGYGGDTLVGQLNHFDKKESSVFKDFLFKTQTTEYRPVVKYKYAVFSWDDCLEANMSFGIHMSPQKYIVVSDDISKLFYARIVVDEEHAYNMGITGSFAYYNCYGQVDSIRIKFSTSAKLQDVLISIPSYSINVCDIYLVYVDTAGKSWSLYRLEESSTPTVLVESGSISTA